MSESPLSLRCPKCDYDLKGLTEPRCPECGQELHVSTPGAERAIGIAVCRVVAIWLLCNGVLSLAGAVTSLVISLVRPFRPDDRMIDHVVLFITPVAQLAMGIPLWMFAHRIACSISSGFSLPRPDRWNLNHIEWIQIGLQLIGAWTAVDHIPLLLYAILAHGYEPNASDQRPVMVYHAACITIGLLLLLRVGWMTQGLVRFAKSRNATTAGDTPLPRDNPPDDPASPTSSR